MKQKGNTIVFDSEALALQALVDLRFCAAIRDEQEKTRAALAAMSREELEEMNREMAQELAIWNRGLCPTCNPQTFETDARKQGEA
jgi:hypothetical protein